ncbi:MAG: glycosyltransferase family 4 protein [Phycisphaerae bacterium]|nr:glycosyltransferase family 4 protein [Phycisphaerae bacterium]
MGRHPPCAEYRPRVVVLAAHYLEYDGMRLEGGAEKYIRACVRALVSAGAEVVVNFSGDDIYAPMRQEWDAHAFSSVRTDWLDRNLGGDRRLQWRTIRERLHWFRSVRPGAVLVVQQGHGTAFGASIVAARWSGARVVMSVRQPPLATSDGASGPDRHRPGIVPSMGIWRWRGALRRRWIWGRCDAIVFNSHRIREAYRQAGFDVARGVVVANGVEVDVAQRDEQPGGPLRIGFVGQLAHHKGADLVATAFRRLAARGRPVRLSYFGDGSLRRSLKASLIGLPVRFAGFVPERSAIIREIDVLVLPSRREASSNAVLEAMAHGVPCIVSEVGGLPELVEDGVTGRVIPADDAAALEGAIEELLDDPELLRRFGHAARARVLAAHRLEDRMRETVELVLGGKLQSTIRQRVESGHRDVEPVATIACADSD